MWICGLGEIVLLFHDFITVLVRADLFWFTLQREGEKDGFN